MFSLQMLTDRDIHKHFAGNLSEYMYVSVKMDSGLFAAWVNGGLHGTYAALDQANQTVTYDPSTPLRLDSITLDSSSKFYVDISFTLRNGVTISVPAIQDIHFQQLYINNGQEQVYGRVSYRVHIADTSVHNGGRQIPKSIVTNQSANYYFVYPNPSSDILNIVCIGDKQSNINVVILDMTDRALIKKDNLNMQNGNPTQINIENLVPGMYLIYLEDIYGYKKAFKISKIE